MRDYRNYQVWEKAHQFVLAVYAATRSFPVAEQYGLTGQLRRSAASIPANIAEGCGRSTDADFARFLQIASGSANESEYQLLLARDLNYIDSETHDQLVQDVAEIRKMLAVLMTKLRA
jgi:four helix bundle protein